MGIGCIVVAVVWILSAAKGNALKCYVCTTTLLLPGNVSKTSGCSPGEPMNIDFLKECDQNDTHCNTHKITARIATSFGVLTTVAYELRCSSSPSNLCESDVYNISGVQYSEGCHKSCQTDGCNSLVTPLESSTVANEVTSRPEVTENKGLDLAVLLGSIAAAFILVVLIVVIVVLSRRKNTKSSKPDLNNQPSEEPAELTSRKPQDTAPSDSVKYESINDDAQCDSEGYLIVQTDDTKLSGLSQQYEEIPLQETTDKVVA